MHCRCYLSHDAATTRARRASSATRRDIQRPRKRVNRSQSATSLADAVVHRGVRALWTPVDDATAEWRTRDGASLELLVTHVVNVAHLRADVVQQWHRVGSLPTLDRRRVARHKLRKPWLCRYPPEIQRCEPSARFNHPRHLQQIRHARQFEKVAPTYARGHVSREQVAQVRQQEQVGEVGGLDHDAVREAKQVVRVDEREDDGKGARRHAR
mmetsp:Transcript_24902/g.86711  ORF Transcript_24902/g.86711 Transcript_24902/m.86711 type:complete len:212 (+) Transcript_24902:60-695(+)